MPATASGPNGQYGVRRRDTGHPGARGADSGIDREHAFAGLKGRVPELHSHPQLDRIVGRKIYQRQAGGSLR
jgi:hypothetical protein